jgi:AcrR family transcriptional regulator
MANGPERSDAHPPGPSGAGAHADADLELVLEAAARVFSHRSLAATSHADVATAAGVPVDALRARYPRLADLLHDVVAAQVDERLAEAAWLVEADATGRAEAAAAMSRLLVAVADKDTDSALLQAELWRHALTDPVTMDRLADRARAVDRAIGQVSRARFARLDPGVEAPFEAMATVLTAMFEGLLQRRRTDPDAVPDELLGQALLWLLDGVRVSGPPAR